MENITSKYEVIYVVDGTLAEEAATELINKFKAMIEANATIDEVQDWGKKKLAYLSMTSQTDTTHLFISQVRLHSLLSSRETSTSLTVSFVRLLLKPASKE